MGTWARLGQHMIPLGRRKLGIRSWAYGRMGKGLRTGWDWSSLRHLDGLWGDYPRLLDFQLDLFLLEGIAGTLSMFTALFSL